MYFPSGHLILAQAELLESYGKGLPEMESSPVKALASAIAASPGWPSGCQAALVVRQEPTPVLAVLGCFSEPAESWLRRQIRTLHKSCGTLRYINPKQVKTDYRLLADRLRALLGKEGLARARFTAIPRGGIVVLDLLVDRLGIGHDQLRPPFPPDCPLVVVDDCALSGARFHQFLRQVDHPSVVFATLCSHPDLRASIRRHEPRVASCLSARDLGGRQIEETGATDRYYWSGEVEALCFPWNEPDRLFRNPTTGNWELAWRIVPPELCAKNRPAPGTQPIPIQVQPEGKGPLRPSARALTADVEGTIIVCDVETGKTFSLAGSGSDLWRALVRHGDLEAAVADLHREYAVPEETLLTDARRFRDELCARGLLEISAMAALSVAS